jgi:hypothetical protein
MSNAEGCYVCVFDYLIICVAGYSVIFHEFINLMHKPDSTHSERVPIALVVQHEKRVQCTSIMLSSVTFLGLRYT